MIEQIETTRPDVLEFRVSGTVSDSDYSDVMIPALEAAIAEREHIRVLVRFDSGFKDFTLGALFDDAKMGMKHWRGFDRLAVVTDSTWMTRAVKAMSVFLPCPVMTFDLAEVDEARTWLVESLGTIHQTDLGGGVLHLQLRGKLDTAVFEREVGDINAFVRRNDRFRLLLDLRDFDGWQGLAALGTHLQVVRDHAGVLDRAAVVGDAAWQRLGERVVAGFVRAETRYFASSHFDEAREWVMAE